MLIHSDIGPSQLLLLSLTLCYSSAYIIHIPNYSDRLLSGNRNNYNKLYHGQKATNNVPINQAPELIGIGSVGDISDLRNPLNNKPGQKHVEFPYHVVESGAAVKDTKAKELDLLLDELMEENREELNKKQFLRFRGKRGAKRKPKEEGGDGAEGEGGEGGDAEPATDAPPTTTAAPVKPKISNNASSSSFAEKGDAMANTVARDGGSSVANAATMGGKGNALSRSLATGSGNSKAGAHAADGGNATSMAKAKEGNATTTAFTKGGGAAFAGSETAAKGDSVASALSLQGGASRAEAKSKDGNAMATAIQGGDRPEMEDPFDDPFFKSNQRGGRKRRSAESQFSPENSILDSLFFSKKEEVPVITITIDGQDNGLGSYAIPKSAAHSANVHQKSENKKVETVAGDFGGGQAFLIIIPPYAVPSDRRKVYLPRLVDDIHGAWPLII